MPSLLRYFRPNPKCAERCRHLVRSSGLPLNSTQLYCNILAAEQLNIAQYVGLYICLLYTSDAADE